MIETADIFAFYKQQDPALNESTIRWRIYKLVQSGILDRVSKGRFRLGQGRRWHPEITPRLAALYRKLKKQYPFLKTCVWNTSVFNEFMVHQLFRYVILIEVEKDAMESVFFRLKDEKYNVALDPSDDFIYKYLPGKSEMVIVKPLISEAPLQLVKNIYVPSLEKILVDIYCDSALFASQQGSELHNIFSEAFRKYSVIIDRLLRYASRRGKREQLADYICKIQIYGNNDDLLPVYRK